MDRTLLLGLVIIVSVNAFNGKFNGQGNGGCTTCGLNNGNNNNVGRGVDSGSDGNSEFTAGARRVAGGASGNRGSNGQTTWDCETAMRELGTVINTDRLRDICGRGNQPAGPSPTPEAITTTTTTTTTAAPTTTTTTAAPTTTTTTTAAPTTTTTTTAAPTTTASTTTTTRPPSVAQSNNNQGARIHNPKPPGHTPNLRPRAASPSTTTTTTTTTTPQPPSTTSSTIKNDCGFIVPANQNCVKFNNTMCGAKTRFDIDLCGCNHEHLIDPITCKLTS